MHMPRMSHQRLKILNRFLERPEAELSGADLVALTSIASGSLYPLLLGLQKQGLLKGRWEAGDPRSLGRPLRRLYRLTPSGRRAAEAANADLLGNLLTSKS